MGEVPARALRPLYTNPYTNRGMRRPSWCRLIPWSPSCVAPTFMAGHG
jgi:hypothetical protein